MPTWARVLGLSILRNFPSANCFPSQASMLQDLVGHQNPYNPDVRSWFAHWPLRQTIPEKVYHLSGPWGPIGSGLSFDSSQVLQKEINGVLVGVCCCGQTLRLKAHRGVEVYLASTSRLQPITDGSQGRNHGGMLMLAWKPGLCLTGIVLGSPGPLAPGTVLPAVGWAFPHY